MYSNVLQIPEVSVVLIECGGTKVCPTSDYQQDTRLKVAEALHRIDSITILVVIFWV
jgi:hypothetical protein